MRRPHGEELRSVGECGIRDQPVAEHVEDGQREGIELASRDSEADGRGLTVVRKCLRSRAYLVVGGCRGGLADWAGTATTHGRSAGCGDKDGLATGRIGAHQGAGPRQDLSGVELQHGQCLPGLGFLGFTKKPWASVGEEPTGRSGDGCGRGGVREVQA